MFSPLADTTVQSENSECNTLLQKYSESVFVMSAAAVVLYFKSASED